MMGKKILLTGVNGQVGHALQAALSLDTHHQNTVVALNRTQLDLTRTDEIRRVVQLIKPDLVIHPAAYTAVDKAETESELTFAVNAIAPRVLAEETEKLGAKLIQFSTDYVYDGKKNSPYEESDETAPLNVYGRSKLAGEQAIQSVGVPHLIFRTSWVYGAYGHNFLKTILRLATEREELRIVADQLGAPTSASCIADAVLAVLAYDQPDKTGVYHLVNAGKTSWHGFALAILEEYATFQHERGWLPLKASPESVLAINTAAFPTPAGRPANSVLNCNKLAQDFAVQLPNWRDGLHQEFTLLER